MPKNRKGIGGRPRMYEGVDIVRTSVILPRPLYERAKRYGLSFSIILRDSLEQILERLEGEASTNATDNNKKTLHNGGHDANNKPRAGLEPATCGLQDRCSAS